jgi:hypothetical protein
MVQAILMPEAVSRLNCFPGVRRTLFHAVTSC